ncbi:cold shock domain-containing protein [Candidatus Falkowbacteria bacterium]|nr:cold shock domain-containing protein [Candidatus Falkowbacteria bacterium]
MTGTIKKLVEKGFGFISREGEEKDLFFHKAELKGVTFEDLKEGDTLNFDIDTTGDRGPAAVNVTRV